MAVTLSAGVRQALSSLQATAAQQSATQNRLATGKKVNSALDNPSSFFQAAGLNNRAGDLGTLLDSMGQAVKTLEAADKGIKGLQKLVDNAKSIAKQAQAAALPVSTKLTGNQSGAALASGTSLTATLGFATSDTITLTSGSGSSATTVTFTVGATSTVNDLMTAISTVVSASITGGQLELTESDQTALKVTSSNSGSGLSNLLGTNTSAPAGDDGVRKKAAADFDAILSQINELAKDSGYNGVNLLNGDSLTVNFNEKGTSKLAISGKTFQTTSNDLSIAKSTNNWKTAADVQTSLDALDTASSTLRTQASTFGANLSVVQNRVDFTKSMIDTLQTGADALTNADTNEEGASLLALNTRAQLSQTALSLASQADQAVLRLF